MKRAYLDQKDYLRMAAGLGGDARYARDAEVFEKLTAHVQAGELTVYFSWAHFVEALRFRGENTTTLQRYCEVADGLTQGNCIVLHHELLEAELERFLSSRFGFQPSHSAAYAYGKWADALGKQDETPDPFIYLRERMSALIEEMPASPAQKELARAALSDRSTIRSVLRILPDSVFDEMNTRFRSSPKFYDRESVAEMFAGSPIEQRQRKQEWTDGMATFLNLVAHYGNRVADLEHMSRIPDQAAKALLDGIARIQAGEMEAEPSERLAATLRDRFIASLREDIARLADRYKFNKDDAETIVRDDALRALPSASVVVSLFREHYRRHVGPIGKVRKADANDVMDMHHLRSLPYVDFQATDAFWADCARGTAKNFGTRLTKNTVDLLAAVTANL